MSDKTTISRRRFAATAASITIASIAGCSGDDGEPTETDGPNTSEPTETTDTENTPTDTSTDETNSTNTTDTEQDVGTATGEPEDGVSDGVIETLSDYAYIAERPDEFVGTNISMSNVSYYDEYGEYYGFRKFFDEGVRPVFVKLSDNFPFSTGEEFHVNSGTIEKIEKIQDTPVIYLEDDAVIESADSGETFS